MRRVLLEIWTHAKLYIRHRETMFWNFVFPVFLMLIFGSVFRGGDQIRVDVGVSDRDSSTVSLSLIEGLRQVPVLRIREGSMEELRGKLESRDLVAVFHFPEGFALAVDSGDARIEALYNPEDQQGSQIALTVLDQALSAANEMFTGVSGPFGIERVEVQPTERTFRYIDFFVPGIVGMTIMSTALFGIGVAVAGLREKKILRRLRVTPLSGWVFILGQIVSRFFFVILQALFILLVGILVFKVRLSLRPVAFAVTLGLSALSFISIGFLVASVARRTESALMMANVLFFPMLFLSGTWFPVSMMPRFLHPLIKILPATYMLEAIRGSAIHGFGLTELGTPILVLLGWLLACTLISVKVFRWE
jgi:ABC-2 type transport system permease protein